MNHQISQDEINSILWKACDTFRGTIDPSQARRIFAERLEVCLEWMRFLKLDNPQLEIRQMETRWGSCTLEGKILLNLKLIQVPKIYIDYVVVHELCHLKEPNHSRRFYDLLDRVMPNWRSKREQLNRCEVG